MTREEAIHALKEIKHYVESDNASLDCRKAVAGLDFAISALRPVSREKVWRGEWITPTIIGGRAFNIPHCSVCNGVPCGTDEHTRFCAHCGAPMTDEAVQMVMERLEALYENP